MRYCICDSILNLTPSPPSSFTPTLHRGYSSLFFFCRCQNRAKRAPRTKSLLSLRKPVVAEVIPMRNTAVRTQGEIFRNKASLLRCIQDPGSPARYKAVGLS